MALALIAAGDLVTAPDEKTTDATTRRFLLAAQNAAPYGYLLLNAMGWFGLRDAISTRIHRAAKWLFRLFVVSVILFLGLEFGVIPQEIVIIALDLTLLVISGIAGMLAILVAIVLTLTGGIGASPITRPPIGPTPGRTGGITAAR